jgi:hypothetical protein
MTDSAIRELIDTMAEARELIREMHEATRDLRQATREARRVTREELNGKFNELCDEQNKKYAEIAVAEVKSGLEHYGNEIIKSRASVLDELEDVSDMILNHLATLRDPAELAKWAQDQKADITTHRTRPGNHMYAKRGQKITP